MGFPNAIWRFCAPNTEKESEDIRLFLFVKLPNVLVGTHTAADTRISKCPEITGHTTYLVLEDVEPDDLIIWTYSGLGG